MPKDAAVIGGAVSLVMYVVILVLAAVAVAESTPRGDEESTQKSQTIQGCAGAVVGLSVVGVILAIITLAMYTPVRQKITPLLQRLSPTPYGGRYGGSSVSYGSSSSSSLFPSVTPTF